MKISKMIRHPGIEPGPPAWKADVLTTTPVPSNGLSRYRAGRVARIEILIFIPYKAILHLLMDAFDFRECDNQPRFILHYEPAFL